MQLKGFPGKLYRFYRYASRQIELSEQIEGRRKLFGDWEILKKRGVPDEEIAKVTGISRASYYRIKKNLKVYGLRGLEKKSRKPHRFRQSKIPLSTRNRVYQIRKQNPTYGKEKITTILKRDYGVSLSESSVGRLLTLLRNKGLITRSYSSVRVRRKRIFPGHAKPWTYTCEAKKPGQMVQIDHMIVSKNGMSFRQFQAIDPTTKTLVAEVYSNATSVSAKKFLLKAIREFPFPVQSIQVDGGSEFMLHFEQACLEDNIKLFVLPPKRPQQNGGVERANRIMREEFYADRNLLANSIGEVRLLLSKAVLKYNSFRPHHSLGGLTPLEYTRSLLNSHLQSQML